MPFEFNNYQKQLIDEYRNLIVFGYQKLSSVQLDLNKVRVRKKVLYFMMGAMQSFAESMLKLLSTEPVYEKPGESLLRSQLEIWLNMRFIYSSRSEDKARLFLSDLIMDSTSYAKKHKALWEKYPAWDMEFGTIKKPNDWDKFISENQKLLEENRAKYKDKNVSKLPNLYDRTIAIDKYLEKIGKLTDKNSAVKFYTIFYPYFSDSTHATMSGLMRYMRGKASAKEPFLDIDSKPKDAERLLAVSYVGYSAMLRIFLQIFNAYDSIEFDKFKKYSKSLSKK